MMQQMRALLIGSIFLLAGCGSGALVKPPTGSPTAARTERELSPDGRLARGMTRLGQSRYADAEADLTAALDGSKKSAALLGLSELFLTTGRYRDAIDRAKLALAAGAEPQACALAQARALRATGELAAALDGLRAIPSKDAGPETRLLLGELLLEVGKRAEAEPLLLSLIEDYNSDRVPETDGPGLMRVGRA